MDPGDLRNLRDLGGLRTADGRRVRHGVVYRSATPTFLDAAQVGRLAERLGIRSRVDLRSRSEVAETANPHLEALARVVHHLPIRAGGAWRHRPELDDPGARVAGHYARYLEHSAESVTGFVRLVADPEQTPVLVHCAAGKDRTGVALAVLLSAVGVTREEIVADYARTRDDLERLLLQLRTLPAYQERLAALPEEGLTAEPRSMELFLDRLDATWGGARGYLSRHGVGADDVRRLEAALLEPAPRRPGA